MVEADPRVVLAGDHVLGVGRIDCEDYLCLPAQGAVLIHTDVLAVIAGIDVCTSLGAPTARMIEIVACSAARIHAPTEFPAGGERGTDHSRGEPRFLRPP